MTKNPFVNAISAALYIAAVAGIMTYAEGSSLPDKSILGPIAFISLFTLSAAMMGYLFLSQPLQMYLDGKKQEGLALFLQTLGVFAGLTAIVLALFLSGVFA